MNRTLALLYGLLAYVAFVLTFLYAIGFGGGFVVPKTIDTGTVVPAAEALMVNLLLLSLFALQHSVMARAPFKKWWTQFVPKPIERSTYVLLASLALALLFWQWRPMPTVLWRLDSPEDFAVLVGISIIGWLLALTSTFLINHFELFGVQQVTNNFAGRETPPARFRTPAVYKIVRHPLYLGFVIAIWATPTMTAGHLLFAAATTGYILVGIWLEERDLVASFGSEYLNYKQRVAMLIPWGKPSALFAPSPAAVVTVEATAPSRHSRPFAHRDPA
jgi:methanethiol S-methyltransferase